MRKVKEPSPSPGPRARAAAKTRGALVEAAFEEMHEHGFQGASIDRVLDRLGVTRGALFHHFDSKRDLGYAVVDELIREAIERDWVAVLDRAPDPIEALATIIEDKARSIPAEQLLLGCPLNNLSQEMSPLDEGFRESTKRVFDTWVGAIESALRRAQRDGELAPDVDPHDCAIAVLALYEGGVSLTKNARARAPLLASATAVRRYLESLRPERATARGRRTTHHK